MEFIKNTGNFFKKETVLSIAVILAIISISAKGEFDE